MDYRKKTVVITGAGSGIGRATALCFAHAGANLVLADINFEAASETIHLIGQSSGKTFSFKTDVSDPASVKELVAFTIEKFKTVYAIVNNAAIQINKTAKIPALKNGTASWL